MNYTIEYQDNPNVNREYKSSLFCMSFEDKKELLNLYNALNDSDYTDLDLLIVNTIKNVIYLSMKNDVSFLLGSTMNLYEHQSTYNPNMPLRGLLYFAQLYEKLVDNHNINVYSSKLQKLPTPRYVVFYNGTKQQPDQTIFRLSDAFEIEGGCLECEVLMLNINYGRNKELLDKCHRLKEYSIFVDRVRTHAAKTKELSVAINQAIDECIQEDILKDILTQQRAEVHGMVLTTFDKELYENGLKEDAYMDGKADGFAEGLNQQLINQIQKKLAKGKSIAAIADELEETPEVIEKLISQIR